MKKFLLAFIFVLLSGTQVSAQTTGVTGPYIGPYPRLTWSIVADSLRVIRGEMGDSAIAALADSIIKAWAADDSIRTDIATGLDSLLLKIDSLRNLAVRDSIRIDRDSVRIDVAKDTTDLLRQLVDQDSIRIDRDSIRLDPLEFIYGTAADTTSPGYWYTLFESDSLWHRTTTSIHEKAIGVAIDSVPGGSVCRFRIAGIFQDADYNGYIIPGRFVVNDSVTAGWICPLDTLRDPAKKMQKYGLGIDSITIRVIPSTYFGIQE